MKKFVRTLFAVIALFALVLTAVSCSGEPAEKPDVKLEDLLGTWVYTKDSGEYIRYTFNENNRYTVKSTTGGGAVNGMGDFVLEGNKIKLTPSEGTDKSTHEITKFDGDTMVWGSGSLAREYKKQ